MIVTIVHIRIKKGFAGEFIRQTTINHQQSIKEEGNLRFDFLRSSEDPDKFVLYEAYLSEEAARKHKETGHYLKWRETVEGWMAEPREGIRYQIIQPEDPDLW